MVRVIVTSHLVPVRTPNVELGWPFTVGRMVDSEWLYESIPDWWVIIAARVIVPWRPHGFIVVDGFRQDRSRRPMCGRQLGASVVDELALSWHPWSTI